MEDKMDSTSPYVDFKNGNELGREVPYNFFSPAEFSIPMKMLS